MSQAVEGPWNAAILAALRRHRALRAVGDLDYKRVLKAALGEKIPQKVLAQTLGVSQPAVAKALKGAVDVVDVLDGHSSATPYEVCQRYAAGLLEREAMIMELAAWPYPPTPMADEYGDYQDTDSGTFDDVVVAKRLGLIDGEAYAEIVARITASS
ncbi:hypothetical protein [Glutamicibacter protophormiae]|uniref:Uncharacterized protein n=1 Tax=Glutamicibacter protophormiae TaxID=37930 RepID=A0ABS4XVX4_GLUPR|nr:hypothetical protein [Glutamicibacter protophormiae]MBP2400530.1 hypothetical protein [Glutamicibacter protophormiae]GGM01324.1 hypothetical protein GCM10010038_34210 [Glutamicibacter protophormiae]